MCFWLSTLQNLILVLLFSRTEMISDSHYIDSYAPGIKSNSHKMERQTTSTLRKMSAEMLDTAEETIIDYITCPNCNDYIQPPSFCCEFGHFVCCGCKEQISKCPVCGSKDFPNKTNAVFDMILRDIYYPCYYQGNGCSAYFKCHELREHHLTCKFKLEPCAFQSAGCPLYFKKEEKAMHEAKCEYAVSCRIYTKIKGNVHTECKWRGPRKDLPLHVTKSHQLAWCPHEIESNVALSWMLPMNFNFEKVELIHLKDVDEMFYFYSKSIGNLRHFVAVQFIGHKETWKDYLYSVEFSYESKRVGFEDMVIPYNVNEEDIYRSSNCFSVNYEFLKQHFLAERVIDCYVKVFKKDQKVMEAKRYLTYLDNVIKVE